MVCLAFQKSSTGGALEQRHEASKINGAVSDVTLPVPDDHPNNSAGAACQSSRSSKKMSLKASILFKLTLFIGIVVVSSSGVLAAVLWFKTHQQLADEIGRRLAAVSVLRREQLNDYLLGEIDKMVLIASRIQIVNNLANTGVTRETAKYDLQSAISAISEITGAAVYNKEGSLHFATSNNQTFSPSLAHQDYKLVETAPVQIAFPKLRDKLWEYNISRAIMLNQTMIGVLTALINATTLKTLIHDRTGLQNTGELIVGVPIENKTVHLLLPPQAHPGVTSVPLSGSMASAIGGLSGVRRERDYRGVEVIVAYAPVGYLNWGLLAKLDIKEAYAPISNIQIVIVVTIVVILVVGIIASLCLAKVFTAPIIELGKVAAALGSGDMGARVKSNSAWFRDEIHDLQGIFNSMADQISDHHSTLEQKVAERTRDLARANEILATEIEERKRMEMELQMAKDVAVAADKAKSEFLANMSHEIRTPLNGIINCTELCLDTQTSTEQQEYLELVRFSAKHLLRIITDILDFSKIEAGKLEMEDIQFSLYDQLEHAVSVLAARAHKKNLELAWSADADVPDQIVGDPGRLFQVFVNLIGNGIKFTEDGEVVVLAKLQNKTKETVELLFSVNDTGVGIPKNKQSLLFQAFSQVDSSTTRLYGGTGLGLVISSKLAAAMGGRMWVESEGQGSTFYFTATFHVPVSVPGTSPPLGVESLKDVSSLVVDDNKTSRDILVRMLRAWGMVVESANGVEDALSAFQRAAQRGQPFRVLLLDMWLKGTSATDLVKSLQENPSLIQSRSTARPLSGVSSSSQTIHCNRLCNGDHEVEPECPSILIRGHNKLPNGIIHKHRGSPAQSSKSQVAEQNFSTPSEGTKCLDQNLKDTPMLPIVMLTSLEHSDAARCKQIGVDVHTSKPIKRALLKRALNAALGIPEDPEIVSQEPQGRSLKQIPEGQSKGLKILVAEDNVVNQRVAMTLLQKWGHATVLACNGSEAVEQSSKEFFDLVLMDVQMPICDGFQATREIRELEKSSGVRTPIVAMTAHAMSGDGDRCIAAGMDGYISKPLNAKKLKDLLELVATGTLRLDLVMYT
ncbi:uncharacterized protein LOC9635761 [Selaginella moellendorffii]|nr:uncharacterized protein LOC9635761 [Selaginella moellendorffii]|eukprot:XP_002967448.2 uncharacterized protein LOC9635761 [Selaginella moellendorffii]